MPIKYAYRLETKRIKETDFPYNAEQTFNDPESAAHFAQTLQDADIEKFLILYLNSKNRLICIQITPGTINKQVIYPREIIKHALLSSAASLILIHNHPSGIPEPSPEDQAFTHSIKEACKLLDIAILDHVILGEEGKFFSFAQSRIL